MNEPTRTPADQPGRAEAGWSGVLLLLAVLVDESNLPWALLAAIPALGAAVLSVRVALLRRRAGQGAAAAWAGIGTLLALYVLGSVAIQAALYGPVDTFRRCTDAANTQVAHAECVQTMRSHLGNLPASLLGE